MVGLLCPSAGCRLGVRGCGVSGCGASKYYFQNPSPISVFGVRSPHLQLLRANKRLCSNPTSSNTTSLNSLCRPFCCGYALQMHRSRPGAALPYSGLDSVATGYEEKQCDLWFLIATTRDRFKRLLLVGNRLCCAPLHVGFTSKEWY